MVCSIFKLLTFVAIFISFTAHSQDWRIFNDTLPYYYKSSTTEDIFTLRTKTINYTETDSIIWFTDNFIPVDADPGYYYSKNGSVWGDSIHFSNDSLWLDGNHLFLNNQPVGSSWNWNEFIEITLTHESDSIIFEIPDSVRYYSLSDGNRIIQSKNFGWLEFPSLVVGSETIYNLIGIEQVMGQQFNNHNLIFDFEPGDILLYREHYYAFNELMEVTENFSSEVAIIYTKTLIDGNYFYEEFPVWIPFNPDSLTYYFYPGERVKNFRANFLLYSFDESPYFDEWGNFVQKFGWNTDTTTEGHYIECVGFSELPDGYLTFGEPYPGWGFEPNLNYSGSEICQRTGSGGQSWCTYEEGFGLTHYCETHVESYYRIDLIGAIKSGVKMGYYIDAGLHGISETQIKVYPNPTNDLLFLECEATVHIRLVNMIGETVLIQQGNEISLNTLESGVYYLFIYDQSGQPLTTTKIIKE